MYLLKPLLEAHNIPFFVETGTAGGESVRQAYSWFRKCWTVEIVLGRAPTSGGGDNIEWLQGNSPVVLEKIIDEIAPQELDTVFWLDAHYSDPTPNESNIPECPLFNELDAIARYREHAIIIIDDARLYMGQPPYPLDPRFWPGIQDVFLHLKNQYPHNYSTVTDDYIISVPIKFRATLDNEWRSRFAIRYPNESLKLRTETRDVVNAFLNYIDYDRALRG